MSLHGIVVYTLRAVLTALPLTAAVWLLRLRRREEKRGLRLLFVFYLMCLLSVTVLRDGKHLTDFWKLPHGTDGLQLTPIRTTLRMARAGAWAVIYPVVGNLAWFFPFGLLRRRLRPGISLLRTAAEALALSLSIEVLQWVLCSGISDIDDVIFNGLGGILGWCAARLLYGKNLADAEK